MRTTVELNDALFVAAKRLAAEQHTSLKAVIEDGLRILITSRSQPGPAAAWPISQQAKPVAGVDLTSTTALFDLT